MKKVLSIIISATIILSCFAVGPIPTTKTTVNIGLLPRTSTKTE